MDEDVASIFLRKQQCTGSSETTELQLTHSLTVSELANQPQKLATTTTTTRQRRRPPPPPQRHCRLTNADYPMPPQSADGAVAALPTLSLPLSTWWCSIVGGSGSGNSGSGAGNSGDGACCSLEGTTSSVNLIVSSQHRRAECYCRGEQLEKCCGRRKLWVALGWCAWGRRYHTNA